jgi:hypothetical protein
MATLVNCKNSKYDQLIDRTTIFGNPFPVEKWGRAGCIKKFETYFYKRIERDPAWKVEVLKLRDKILGCHCWPLDCHGRIYLEFFATYDQMERFRILPVLKKILADIDILATDHGWYEPELQGEAFSRIQEMDCFKEVVAAAEFDHEFDVIGAINKYIEESR